MKEEWRSSGSVPASGPPGPGSIHDPAGPPHSVVWGAADHPVKLNEYITNFYSSLYRTDVAVQGEIDDFLGPDIQQHPLVRGSILTAEERENLDRDLNILELDNSLEHANFSFFSNFLLVFI